MHIPVTSEIEHLIKTIIQSGQYANTDELISDALHSLLADDEQYTSITKQRTHNESEMVLSQLQEHIYRGQLQPGERLTPTKRIAQLMRVSPSSVNTAIQSLMETGYLQRRDGNYYVGTTKQETRHNPFSSVTMPHAASLNELLEVRAGLEGHGVILAVERATDQDIEFLKDALRKVTTAQQDSMTERDADIAFHMGIAYATHNLVYIDLIRRFYDQMFLEIDQLHSLLYETPDNLLIIEQHHFKILHAISSRDKDGAKRHMLQHILFLKSFINNEGIGIQNYKYTASTTR